MNTLIVYDTQYGNTEKIAGAIARCWVSRGSCVWNA